MDIVQSVIWIGTAWLWVGAAVAAGFLLIGLDRIDERARGAYTFRPLMVPAILLLWPLVVWRWYALETGRSDWQIRQRPLRDAHAPVWIGLTAVVALVLITAIALRQPWPAPEASQQLSGPRTK
jgi:hypothetical protein